MPRARPSAGAEQRGKEWDQCPTVQRGIPAPGQDLTPHLPHLTEPSLARGTGAWAGLEGPAGSLCGAPGSPRDLQQDTWTRCPNPLRKCHQAPLFQRAPNHCGRWGYLVFLCASTCQMEKSFLIWRDTRSPPKLCGEPEDKGHTHIPVLGYKKDLGLPHTPSSWARRKWPKKSGLRENDFHGR